ncbi:MAG TPA: hypothetical protein VL485_22700 [Ktedonobacteraceae bacterium]|jgi:hypothetical protein|nr:hypothetical protein [Ktedonobacteraceae bacterium]
MRPPDHFLDDVAQPWFIAPNKPIIIVLLQENRAGPKVDYPGVRSC